MKVKILLVFWAFAGNFLLSAKEFSQNQTGNDVSGVSSSVIQQITVTGTVTDKDGPLTGVNVIIKGTLIGVVTDLNGKYTITVPNGNTFLVFSFVGYATVELQVGDRRVIDVELAENVRELEEVVVVGYGTVKKSDLTGSVTSVTPRSFLDQPASSVNSVLVGRAPEPLDARKP